MTESNGKNELLSQIEAVVFDFDGTLASLEIDFDLMRRRVLELAVEFGRGPVDFEGRYVLESISLVESRLTASNPKAAREFVSRAHHIIEDMELDAARRGGLFPCTRPALRAFKNAGLKMAIITRNFHGAVGVVFPDLFDFCSVFLPREAAPRVKPDAAHLLAALDALKVEPAASLMVGDHPMDIETGRKAGTMTVGVASGRIGLKELQAAGADFTCRHVGELADLLLGPSWESGTDIAGNDKGNLTPIKEKLV